jgi:hypothetical protein
MENNKTYTYLLSYNANKALKLSTYSWGRDVIIILPEFESQYLELYEKFKDNKLKNNTSVYLTPIASLPSYKLKNYIEENKLNINLTRTYSKLNAIIIDDNFIRESYLYIGNWKPHDYYTIPVDYIESKFKKYIDYQDDRFITIINNKKIDSFLIQEEQIKELAKTDSSFLGLLNFPTIYGRQLDNSHGSKKAHDNYNMFCKLKETVEKYNLEIIFDHNINEEINKDLVIDVDMFQNIFNMLISKDEGNIKIAKEIMANCSLEKSKPYLIYLMNLFPALRKASDNKNYNFIYKKLIKEAIAPWVAKDSIPSSDSFIFHLLNKNPKFASQYMECFKVHLNNLAKKDIIKEIILV